MVCTSLSVAMFLDWLDLNYTKKQGIGVNLYIVLLRVVSFHAIEFIGIPLKMG